MKTDDSRGNETIAKRKDGKIAILYVGNLE